MSLSRHLPTLVASLVAIGALGLAWTQYRAVRDMRSLGLTPEDKVRLEKAVSDAQKRTKEVETKLTAAIEAEKAAAAAADEPARQPGNRAMGDFASSLISRLDNPEIRRLRDIQMLAMINRRNAEFYRQAKLTPDQIKGLQQLLLDRQNAGTDVLIAATQQGINPMQNPGELSQLVKDAQAELDAKIQALLGPDAYGQYQNFQQTQVQRNVVNQLQQDLNYTETPLTDAQRSQMLQVMAQSNPKGGGRVNDATLNLAQGILSQPQVQALQNIQKLQQINAQLRNLMRSASKPGG
jgi:hypothetical protein